MVVYFGQPVPHNESLSVSTACVRSIPQSPDGGDRLYIPAVAFMITAIWRLEVLKESKGKESEEDAKCHSSIRKAI